MKKIIFELSPNFTIEDIHKIREYHYAMTKDLSDEDRRRYYNDASFARQIDEKNKDIAELVYV